MSKEELDAMPFDEMIRQWSPSKAAEWKRVRAGLIEPPPSIWARVRAGGAYQERGFPYLLSR